MTLHFTHALTRTPSASMAAGLTTQSLGAPEVDLAMQQYEDYVAALRTCGLNVTTVPADEDFPDGHFVEDTAVIYRDLAVITCPGAESRRGETRAIEQSLQHHKRCGHIDGDGRLDGGDVLVCADRVLIGLSERTNAAGAEQLKAFLQEVDPGLQVDFVAFTGVLHLKSGLTQLAPGMLLRARELYTDYVFDFAEVCLLPAAESYAADVLPVNDAVLIPAGYPTVKRLAARHYTRIFELEMSEFQKMDGGLTCLSLLY
jgi:dimethylargininase